MNKTISLVAKCVIVVIMTRAAFGKFTANPILVELFDSIDMEPKGRIAVGVIEIIVWLVIVFGWPFVRMWAIVCGLLMIGALYYHAMFLGVNGWFWLALLALASCIVLVVSAWKENCNLNAE